MPVATFSFLLFISATLLVYFTVPRRSQWIVLLVASYVFYASAGVKQLLFLVLTTIISFSAGFLLAGVKNKNKKKFILASALVLDFGLLVFLKYYNFAASGINALLAGTGFALPVFKLLLPLGISFYIFQSAGYVIDVYRENTRRSGISPDLPSLFLSFRRLFRVPSAATTGWHLNSLRPMNLILTG